MVDNVSPQKRSEIMKAVHSKSTKLEQRVRKKLWRLGIRYRINVSDLVGKPDIAIKKYKLVIFIDSCFWHGCPEHGRIPKSNTEFWLEKIKKNKQRDVRVTEHYHNNGWSVLRIWEHQLRGAYFDETVDYIYEFIIKLRTKRR